MGQSTQLVFDGSAEQKFDFKQEIGVADDKEHLEEEEALHSGSVERFLLNRSARTKDNEEKPEQNVHTVRDNMLFVDNEENGGIDDYTMELDNLYTSCL